MRIIYVAPTFSDEKYNKLVSIIPNFSSNAIIRFHKLFINGLAINGIDDIHVVSYIPISSKTSDIKEIDFIDEIKDNIYYHYVSVRNNRFRNLNDFIHVQQVINSIITSDCVIISDMLRFTTGLAVTMICRKYKIKNFGIITDVPSKRLMTGSLFIKILDSFILKNISQCYGYIFLTEQMNSFINKKSKPFCVIEGLCDISESAVDSEKKDYPMVVMYAGTLNVRYGINELVQGFLEANIPNTILEIYGTGNYQDELIKICAEHSNVVYHGVVKNEDIRQRESAATLLVNPRPNSGEYTKYSFPSKNIEYMSSGTPLLACQLPGIPKEYYKYFFELQKTTSSEIKETLEKLFLLKKEDLINKGIEAKKFVRTQKNNVIMTKKVIELIGANSNDSK